LERIALGFTGFLKDVYYILFNATYVRKKGIVAYEHTSLSHTRDKPTFKFTYGVRSREDLTRPLAGLLKIVCGCRFHQGYPVLRIPAPDGEK